MLQLQLPEEIEDRLDLLSLGSGHTLQFYVLEAVLEYLDDIEARQGQAGPRGRKADQKIGRDGRI